jgi:hypothetical protein
MCFISNCNSMDHITVTALPWTVTGVTVLTLLTLQTGVMHTESL